MSTDLEHQLSIIASNLDRQTAGVTLDDVLRTVEHGNDVVVIAGRTPLRGRPIRWAIAAAAAVALIGVFAATRQHPAPKVTSSADSVDLASLNPADEVAITSSAVDISTPDFNWTRQFDIQGVRPFLVGTPTSAFIEKRAGQDMTVEQARALMEGAVCVGRAATSTTSAGCGKGLEPTYLVVEDTGKIDTIVWRGLPANTTTVVLTAGDTTFWEHTSNGVAAFASPWCTNDGCGHYALTGYDSNGHQTANSNG